MFETDRLILRKFNEADIDAIAALRANPEFMRFINQPETRSEAAAWVRMVSQYWETEKFGFWAVVLKETNQTIGWSGTWRLWETGEAEIGFAIAPEVSRKGFGAEAAGFALKYSFENRNAETVAAVAMPENTGSRRVLEKLGMNFNGERYFGSYNLRLAYYKITKNEYARNREIIASQIHAR